MFGIPRERLVALVQRRVLPNTLAALALVTFALTPWPWLGVVLTALTIAATLSTFGLAGLGRNVAANAMLAGAVLIGYEESTHGEASDSTVHIGLMAAAVVFLTIVANEAILGRVSPRAVRAAHLPGAGGRRLVDPRMVFAAELVAIAAIAVFAAVDAPVWLEEAVIAAMAAAVVVLVGGGLVVRRRAGTELEAVRRAVTRHRPAFMMYFSAPAGSEHQVRMWLPYLRRIGTPFVVVMREEHSFDLVAAMTDAPVLLCPTIAGLEAVIVPSMKAAFYANNGALNTHAVRFGQLTHIQLLHGDSDKAPSYNPVTAMFDKVFVAGQAGIDRYAAHGVLIPEEKFAIVGRPQVDGIHIATGHVGETPSPVVLYAPTWIGQHTDANYCSLPIAEDLIAALLDRSATVIFRPHPYSSRNTTTAALVDAVDARLAEDSRRTGRPHRWGAAATTDLSLVDCFNHADAMIADVSAVVTDFLYSEKPFAITNMIGGTDNDFLDEMPLARHAYLIRDNLEDLSQTLDDLLKIDPRRDDRVAAKIYYLGPFPPDRYAEAFLTEARRYL
jgi:hypothetical protein